MVEDMALTSVLGIAVLGSTTAYAANGAMTTAAVSTSNLFLAGIRIVCSLDFPASANVMPRPESYSFFFAQL